jgi:uncharacterized protein
VSRAASPLQVDVGDLLDHPNTRRPVDQQVTLDDELAVADSRLEPGTDVVVDLVLESMPSGVAANGRVAFGWVGVCRRCLDEVRGSAEADVHEIFEVRPTEDETFPIKGSQIDLEPIVREAVLLGLPLAPLCGDDCRGPAPEVFPAHRPGELDPPADTTENGGARGDPRWSALDDLKFD